MENAWVHLGFSEVSAQEFQNNGINLLDWLQMLTQDALTQLIKQIHQDNQGVGLFIPFFSQQGMPMTFAFGPIECIFWAYLLR
jgi:hypothetical protein